jgi:hypothetical protein
MGTKFDLPPDAHSSGPEKEERGGRDTVVEWDKHQSVGQRIALGVDADEAPWIAERTGGVIELSQPGTEARRTIEAPLTDPERPELSLPRLVGAELLVGRPEGLQFGERLLLPGRFDCYDGARQGESCVLLASGAPEGGEPGTYWIRWVPGDPKERVERLGDLASGVSVWHDPERIGLAWADDKGVHTATLRSSDETDVRSSLVSYYASSEELYTSPSVAVDQTGKAYALFYVFSRGADGSTSPTRDMQLNFERIAFKASATPDGHFPVNLIHRKRIYMIYGMKPGAVTARWRVPGTTMWDGSEHIPGSFPQAVSDGKKLYIATDKGLWVMGAGQRDEGLDLLSHSWASPEGDEGPRRTFGARLRRWLGF